MKRKLDNSLESLTWSALATPCLSLSFLLTVGPAYASHADRLGMDANRSLLRQMRAENRAERLANKALRLENRAQRIESRQASMPISTPQLSNIGANVQINTAAIEAAVRGQRRAQNGTESRLRRNENKTWQVLETGKVRNVNAAVELNFGSNQRSIQLGQNLLATGESVTITVGGGEKTFAAGSKVTAAEYASILQVLGGQGQSLQIDNQGRAAGGNLSLETLTNGSSMNVSGFVIPEAVTVIGNFSNRSDFDLKGDLVNNGAIYALSNKAGANKATIATRNLTNNAGGLISSVTDSSMFPQFDDLQSSVDLKLRADENLVNRGEISSSGNLTLSAKVVSNEDGRRSTATISAARDISIETSSLNNTGKISAGQNIGITAGAFDANGSIAINNTGGSIEALTGSITVGDINNVAKANTSLVGGNWLSQALNLYSGDGALTVDVADITGGVTARTGTANIVSEGETLIIKSLHTSGDPTIKSTGNLVIDDDIITDGGPLALLARGNITFDVDATIDTSSASGAGGSITIAAGANWQNSGPNVSISGGTAGGGSVLGEGDLIDIISDGNTNAGDITIVAFVGTNAGSGTINLDSSTISSLGGVGGNNGNITIIGGGGVTLSDVDAQGIGSNEGTGNVLISSMQPAIVNGPVLINDTTGALVQGSFAPGAAPFDTFDINISGTIFSSGFVQVQSADALSIGDVDAQSILVTAATDIETTGSFVTTGGGVALVAGRNIAGAIGAVTDIDTSSASGDGGNVFIIAGAAFTQNATSLTITGGSTSGGYIDYDDAGGNSGALGSIDTQSSGPDSAGGNVSIIAYRGTDIGGGTILTDFEETIILTGGNGAGANGDLTVIAGQNNGDIGLGVRGIFDTTGSNAVGTGNAYVVTAAPQGNVSISKTTLAVTSGDFKGGAIVNGSGYVDDITVGDGANITIAAGGFLVLTSYVGGDSSTLNISAGGSIDVAEISVGNLVVTAGDYAYFYDDVTAPGGILVVAGGDIAAPFAATVFSTSSATGDAGHISLIAGATFTQNANQVVVTGASAIGGDINFALAGFDELDSSSTAVGGAGGDITLVAFDGTEDSGNIYIQNNATVNSSGTGSGANGSIIMVAGSVTDGINAQIDFALTGAAGTGEISLNNSVPVTPVTLSKQTAGVTSGDFRGGVTTIGDIIVNNLSAPGGVIELISGGTVRAMNVDASAGPVGNGGTVRVRTGDAEVLDIGTLTGNNAIGSVAASAGSTSGNAGTIDIQANGAGGLNITQLGALNGTEGAGGHYRLVALNGSLNLGPAVDLNVSAGTTGVSSFDGGSVELYGTNLTSAGTLTITASPTGTGVAGSVDITAAGGNNLQIGNGANEIELSGPFSNVELATVGGGNIIITAGGSFSATNSITLDSSGDVTVNGAISSPTTTITGSSVINNAGITGSTLLSILANFYTNNSATNGGSILIESFPSSNFVLNGNGTFNATVETIITSRSHMGLSGDQTFTGDVTFNAIDVLGGNINLASTATYVGNDRVEINAYSFTQDGSISGNPLVVNTDFFTIVNSDGNVTLTANLIFTGQNLAVIASGNIYAAGALTINLSSLTADGGSLYLIAGFDSTPATLGQVSTGLPTTITTASATGGSIQLGDLNIDLSSGNGNGGNLVAVASAGNSNSGTIAIGNVTTTGSAGNESGFVQVIGEGGVTVGSIDTSFVGAVDGAVELVVAEPLKNGVVTFENGTKTTAGFFEYTTYTPGNLSIAGIDAGNAGVILGGAQGAANTITQQSTTSIVAGNLIVRVGAGAANLRGTVEGLSASGGTGSLTFAQGLENLVLLSVTGEDFDLDIDADARIFLTPTSITSVGTLTLVGNAGVGVDAIELVAPITATGSIFMTAETGDLTIVESLTAGTGIGLSAQGSLSVTGGTVVTAPIVDLSAGGSLVVAGTLDAPTAVSLSSGDDLLMGDITGSIGTPASLFLESTGGSVGTSVVPFVTSAAQLSVNAAGGSAYLLNTNTAGVNLTSGFAAGEFIFNTSGATTISGDVITSGGTDGDIIITQNGIGALTVAAGVNITSDEGDIVLNNLDINKKTGKIVINDGVTIKGSGTADGVGEVYIVLGDIPLEPRARKAPKNITIENIPDGVVYLGKKGVLAKKQTNIVLRADERNIVFSTGGKQNKKAIVLGSNIAITADPPITTMSSMFATQRVNSVDSGLPSESKFAFASMETPGATTTADTVASTNSARTVDSVLALGTTSGFANLASLPLVGTNANETGSMDSAPALDFANASSVLVTETVNAVSTASAGSKMNEFAVNAIPSDVTQTDFANDVQIISDYLPGAVNVSSPDQSIKLSTGSAVYAVSKDTVVETPDAKVSIARDSVVLVVVGAHGTSVYDLHDSKREGVKVGFGTQSVSLTPGRHATVCARRAGSYSSINPIESILHREVAELATANGIGAFASEFAIPSAIQSVSPLRSLLSSSHPTCTKLSSRMVKTGAILLHLSGSQEPFQHHLNPRVAAYLK